MPALVAGAIEFIGGIVAKSGVVGAFLLRVGGSVLLSTLTSKLFGPKAPKGVGLSGHQVTTSGGLEYRKIVYGQAMVSGPVVFQGTAGTDLEALWTVIPLCQGESEALVSVWLDGEEIPVADIDWTPGVGAGAGSGTGGVSTAKWIGENSEKAVFIYWSLGYADQPANAALAAAFTEITTNFRLRGVTYLITKFVNNVNTEKVWKRGNPQNIKAVVKGLKVYDPRKDSNNGGSGSHRVDDPSTWEWSDNPPLCVAHYLLNFVDVDP